VCVCQSKSLSKGDHSGSLGPSLRNRNIQSVVEESLAINKSESQTQKLNSKHPSKTGILRSNAPEIGFLSTDDLLKAMEPVHKKHIPKLDGHPLYKWDQEIILKTVFRKLDARRRGFITLEDLGQIAQNVGVQQLLAFTVFGAWVKKKAWKKFVQLCDNMEITSLSLLSNGRDSGAPGVHSGGIPSGNMIGREFSNRERTVSAQQWLNAGLKVAHEYSVSRMHVRTEEEHRAIVMNELRRDEGEISTAAWFAEYSRDSLRGLERHANIIRTIQEGDCIWALHGRGTLWMPAVVERVIQTDGASTTGGAVGPPSSSFKAPSRRRISDSIVYDISYFMSNDALQSARAMESARKLLDLPTSKAAKNLSLVGTCVDDSLLMTGVEGGSNFRQHQQPSLAAMTATTTNLISIAGPVTSQKTNITEKLLCEAIFDEVCRKNGVDPAESVRSINNNQVDRNFSPSPGGMLGGTFHWFYIC
jgi:hypothetical protein